MTDQMTLPDERYLAALERQRQRIADGVPLRAYNSDWPGDSDTSCTWGLCSNEVAAWPDVEDHLWPDQFRCRGRVAPKYREPHQTCPFDTRPRPNTGANGCFYTCRIFQGRGPERRPSADQALAL